MLINEVQSKVGLSKKSIRYYEEEGLLNPIRNSINDYRIYTDDDLNILRTIKFLRELGVPICEIKSLKEEKLTLEECMRDRIKKIEQLEKDYQKIKNMCIELGDCNEKYGDIDVNRYLEEVNILNKKGFTMRDLKTSHSKKIWGAIVSSVVFSLLFIFILSIISYFQFKEAEKMPWIIYYFLIFVLVIPIISIVINLGIRIREIRKGEEDEASKY